MSDGEIFKCYLWHKARAECAKIVIAHWSPGTSYVFIEESSQALLCKHVAIIQEALILSRYSWMLTPPHGWWSGDRHCNLIRHCPESVPVITHPLASPHQFYVSVWSRCWEMTRREEWEWGERRAEVRCGTRDHLGEMPSLMTQRWDLSEHNG